MKYQLRKPEGRPYFNLRFTDPKTHKQVKISTCCRLKTEAEKFAVQFLYDLDESEKQSEIKTMPRLMDFIGRKGKLQKIKGKA